jgi:hypothetical protein
MTGKYSISENREMQGTSRLVILIRFGLLNNQPKGPGWGERLKTQKRSAFD